MGSPPVVCRHFSHSALYRMSLRCTPGSLPLITPAGQKPLPQPSVQYKAPRGARIWWPLPYNIHKGLHHYNFASLLRAYILHRSHPIARGCIALYSSPLYTQRQKSHYPAVSINIHRIAEASRIIMSASSEQKLRSANKLHYQSVSKWQQQSSPNNHYAACSDTQSSITNNPVRWHKPQKQG